MTKNIKNKNRQDQRKKNKNCAETNELFYIDQKDYYETKTADRTTKNKKV